MLDTTLRGQIYIIFSLLNGVCSGSILLKTNISWCCIFRHLKWCFIFFYLYLQITAEGETSHCSFSELFKHFFCLFDTMSKVIGNNNIIQNKTHLYKSTLVLRAKNHLWHYHMIDLYFLIYPTKQVNIMRVFFFILSGQFCFLLSILWCKWYFTLFLKRTLKFTTPFYLCEYSYIKYFAIILLFTVYNIIV